VCVLDRGRVQQVDAPEIVYNRPANTFVARTVGTPPMNLVPLDVEAVNGRYELRSHAMRLRAPVGGPFDELRDAASVELGVRSEDVRVGADAGLEHCQLRVIAIEPLGGEVIVDLELDGGILKAMTPPGIAIRPGEIVPVAFDLSRVHLFGKDGRNLYTAAGEAALAAG
jgi:ABC-type sugar transport system ATPase subunit